MRDCKMQEVALNLISKRLCQREMLSACPSLSIFQKVSAAKATSCPFSKRQGVLGPEADGASCASVCCSDDVELELVAFSSFLSPDKKSWMAVSILGRKV